MQHTLERPTSITIGGAASPSFAQDRQTRKWVSSDASPKSPTRADVLRYSQKELAALRRLPRGWDGGRGSGLRPDLAGVAYALIDAIMVEDGLATPQFSPIEDGGLCITWLVGGNRLTLLLDKHEIDIRGVWREGHEAFRFDREYGAYLPSELEGAIHDAQSFLLKISTLIRHQLLSP